MLNQINQQSNPQFNKIEFNELGGGARRLILDFIYPVKSYFVTENPNLNTEAKVAAHFGGTWYKIPDGTFLEAGSTITNHDAGLPNITGTIARIFGYGLNATGTLQIDKILGGASGNTSGGGADVSFDASKMVNSLYGKSTTVQPKSRVVYIYRRES